MKKLLAIVLASVAVVALASCGGGVPGESPSPTPEAGLVTPQSTPSECVPGVSTGSLPEKPWQPWPAIFARLSLDRGRTQFMVGEPIKIALLVSNCGSLPEKFVFCCGQVSDLAVTTEDGIEVWRGSYEQGFPAVVLERTVKPGENLLAGTDTWDQRDNDGKPVSAGVYRMRGFITGCLVSAYTGCAPLGIPVITFEIMP